MKKPRSKRQTGNTAPKGGARRTGWLAMAWRYVATFTNWWQWLGIIGFLLFVGVWLSWRALVRLVTGG